MPAIDLRSDTVTRPTPGMMEAIASAELGDDVLGDDPTVHRLERAVAELLGKEAACFVPSGTMANQTAIRALTEPGDEIIADETCHIFHYESGAPAALSGCGIRFVAGERGIFSADQVEGMVRQPMPFYPRSSLLVVENTSNGGGGSVWPIETVREVTAKAAGLGLKRHLDGARLWNACIASGVDAGEYAACFETVSVCFSKGLGAPIGSAVAADAATIERVRRFRKMFGGAMRQAGIIAAAALYAMEHQVDRLADDHAAAKRLAEGVNGLGPVSIDAATVETNIVIFAVDAAWGTPARLCAGLDELGVGMFPAGADTVRAVTHLGVTGEMIGEAIEAVKRVVG